jgi:two-component system OmpR family sensor kinase
MFRSLRFRLPALFLVGIVLAGLISTLIAVKLFQDYARGRKYNELKREATGLALLYSDQAGRRVFSSAGLVKATGDTIFYSGLPVFGPEGKLKHLPPRYVDFEQIDRGRVIRFTLVPPGRKNEYYAAAAPVRLGRSTFGAIVVASPVSKLRASWLTLIERLSLALIGGLIVAGALGWWLSRRITVPVLALSKAADRLSKGRYDVDIPPVRGHDEIADLAESFRAMAARLQEADELERNFLLTVSHELRTPLTAIRGHVEALREGIAADPESRASSLEVIEAETARLERLVGDVLDLAKLNARRFTVLREEVDMRRLLEQAYTAFSEEARRREIDYVQNVNGAPVLVSDGDRLLQIISNLLANAFRWTPDGGRIELELSSDNGKVAVAVSDSGPGIDPSARERIFRPFWSRDGRGTGLGLAISRELAIALGGQLDLESTPGEGSRFELLLPSELGDFAQVRGGGELRLDPR